MRNPLVLSFTALVVSLAWLPNASADAGTGETYFTSIEDGNCKSCHYTNSRRMVGPGLENVTRRHSDEWLRMWLEHPQGTWQGDHPETLELKERTRKVKARATSCVKKPMTEAQIEDLVDFLETLNKE